MRLITKGALAYAGVGAVAAVAVDRSVYSGQSEVTETTRDRLLYGGLIAAGWLPLGLTLVGLCAVYAYEEWVR